MAQAISASSLVCHTHRAEYEGELLLTDSLGPDREGRRHPPSFDTSSNITPTSSTRWCRGYQVCQASSCHNWIWQDRVREGTVCRQCGTSWQKPSQGYAPRWKTSRSVTPPPGLWKSNTRPSKVQKLTGELLASSWDKLDPGLQQKLTEIGISPPPPSRAGLAGCAKGQPGATSGTCEGVG